MQLNDDQQRAFDLIKQFADDPASDVFILRGYAGTGKTTLMKCVIGFLKAHDKAFSLLASTGRAAKVLANLTRYETTTVHGCIYDFNGLSGNLESIVEGRDTEHSDSGDALLLKFSTDCDDSRGHIYIVDEASMISDVPSAENAQATFGSGRLLHDLFEFSPYGKFIFVGDMCQLPPVNQQVSPALSADYIRKTYGKNVVGAELTQVMRQEGGNDIPLAASKLRSLYFAPQPWVWAKFPIKGFEHVHLLPTRDALHQLYIKDVQEHGFKACTLICQSNNQCNKVTQVVRSALGRPYTLCEGDLLLVTQNNMVSGLMNGDLVRVEAIGRAARDGGDYQKEVVQWLNDPYVQENGSMVHVQKAGLSFVLVCVRELFTGKLYMQYVLETLLYQNTLNVTPEQHKELFIDFYRRMKVKDIKQKSLEFRMRMYTDPFLNALRCTWGYALTCHKSQGGEWNTVYLDLSRNIGKMEKPQVYQWMYTAVTRAKCDLYVVNDFYLM